MKKISHTVTLLITDDCNLSCIYCYEHNKSANTMDYDLATSIIDRELSEIAVEDRVIIDLFGGEPFLNFDLIKKIVAHIRKHYSHRDIGIFSSTNGTLVHGEIQEWLIENKDIYSCGLSFDGNEAAQNINRSNSFSNVDLQFFRKVYPQQPIKMTISRESLEYLADSIKFLTDIGFEIQCNFAEGLDWSDEKCIEILREQLDEIIAYYVEHPNVERCSLLNFQISLLSRPRDNTERIDHYCGCGRYMHCYDHNGKCYPCQMFAPISAGNKAVLLKDFDITDSVSIFELDEKCRNCYFRPLCPTCMGSNYIETGKLYFIDDSKCQLQKAVFKANAKLKALEWDKGILSLEEDEEQALLRSIIAIQEL